MVRANHGDLEIDRLQRTETRNHGGEQHGDIDALAIHVLDTNVRIPAAAHIGFLAARVTAGAHQRLIGMRHAERSSGIKLMENAEEEFRRAAFAFLLQVLEVGLELRFEIAVIEVVRLHHVAVGVDDFIAVEHKGLSSIFAIYRRSQRRA